MRVLESTVAFRNAHPNYRSIVLAGSTLGWSRVGSAAPELLCAFRAGQAKMSADGRVRLRASSDLGQTWRDAPSPFAGVPGDASQSGPHLGSSANGTTILMACRMWIVSPDHPRWNDDAAGIVDADCLTTCASAGEPWAEWTAYDFRRTPDEWAIPCGPPLSLGGDEWIFPMERHALPHVPEWLRRYHAFAVFSHDDGRTWVSPTPTLNDPDERVAYYDQRMVVLPSGRVLTMAWIHDVVDDVTLTARAGYSDDGGATWSAPFDTGIQGGPMNPLLLADGRIVAVYARRTRPNGIRAVVSTDGGLTWDTGHEFVLWDEATMRVPGEVAPDLARAADDPSLWVTMWGWTFGSPVAVQAPDGTVLVSFFETSRDSLMEIRCVRLEV